MSERRYVRLHMDEAVKRAREEAHLIPQPSTLETEEPRAEEGTVWPVESSDAGQCEYCGDRTRVKPEPFGGQPACRPCWFQIIDGED